MKLLTLNTHSLMEKDYDDKLNIFVNSVIKHNVDLIALQEIMQPINANMCNFECINAGKIPLKEGNHGLNIIKALASKGEKYNLVWLGFKKSYGKFDEGLAILTKENIEEIKVIDTTPFDEYENWKTRKALGVKIGGEWFYSVHFGWWDSFKHEFEQLKNSIENKEKNWIMGDFNSPACEREKGYDLVTANGFYDTYSLAINKDDGFTASTKIDGWGEMDNIRNVRIDYIFVTERTKIQSSFTIFNGINEPIISDHFGILLDSEVI